MRHPALASFDRPGWRADIVERLERRWIGAGLAYAAVFTAVPLVAPSATFGSASLSFFRCSVSAP